MPFVYRGVGAMEIVAMDMKVSGMYIARQLSFSGVSFRIEEIGLDSDFKLVYNKAAKLVSVMSPTFENWVAVSVMFVSAYGHIQKRALYFQAIFTFGFCFQWAEALQVFMRAADELGLVSRKSLWGQFWSSHQRFFKYLCIAAKVRCLVELAQKELVAGKVRATHS